MREKEKELIFEIEFEQGDWDLRDKNSKYSILSIISSFIITFIIMAIKPKYLVPNIWEGRDLYLYFEFSFEFFATCVVLYFLIVISSLIYLRIGTWSGRARTVLYITLLLLGPIIIMAL